ncbi:MAG TPA: aminotransferase class I/II-fold pyridoxal phosphate-dependent enzyme [Thermoanaerobaculia bacterium]|nr:aminotransferase class I/II-fold pyridoxal phosphate-dependent enzyme [Thermoanaerobaculia bacterium]
MTAANIADMAIRNASPALWEALSPLGRQAQVPANFLPQQTAEARGKTWNATIGQITDGRGGALPLSPMAAALSGLDPARRNQAFLYSPVEGLAELRRLWRERQRRGRPAAPPSGLPIVTSGPVLALSLAAGLFLDAGRTVVLPEPHPPGYPEIFTLRTGARARMVSSPALAEALGEVPQEEPAMVVLRTPAAPGEPELSREERPAVIGVLAAAAAARPLVVLLDDVWERQGSSLFWDILGLHPSLIPVKVDGADGELGFPGAGVGFLTFPFAPESEVATAIEGKVKMLSRAVVGSPPAAGQAILLAALSRLP